VLRRIISGVLDGPRKRALKARLNKAKLSVISRVFRYDSADLKRALTRSGIQPTDTVLVHANFSPESGFAGAPVDLVNALAELIAEKGNLLMVSIPFRGSAFDYLSQGKVFDTRKTMSMMGLATEMFRRRAGTLRSVHPTHPVLAIGKDAPWLVEGHERCRHACGVGSPYDKFGQLRGKILFFDVGFGAITFFHYVEDVLKGRLPFAVYHDKEFTIKAIDADGREQLVHTLAFNPEVKRAAEKLEAFMRREGLIRSGRVGNSRYLIVDAADVVASFTKMVDAGDYPYDV